MVLYTVDMKYSFFNEVSMAQQIRYRKDDLACWSGPQKPEQIPSVSQAANTDKCEGVS